MHRMQPRRAPGTGFGGLVRAALRGFGELCITAGVVMLLFAGYLLWGTGTYTHGQQDDLQKQLNKPQALGKIQLGQAVGLIKIPRFGADYKWAIVEGVERDDLRRGPGHYPGTAMPGQIGNFVLSGHRTTFGAPFNRLGELDRGDEIVIEAREARYIYRVTGRKIVNPWDVEVVAPVPMHPGRRPTQRLLTLTTCHPKFSARYRLILFGKLDRSLPREGATTASGGG